MKSKNPGLGARSGTVAAALAASDAPDNDQATTTRDKPVALSLRLPPVIHEHLRKIAYEQRVPIHAQIMEGIAMYLRTKGVEAE